MENNTEYIAKVCHEANKALCELNGDNSQLSWENAPDWAKKSAIQGVQFKLNNPDATPESQHEAWSKSKIEDGWVYGETKDVNLKTHPCLVEFNQLPKFQQQKDKLFGAIVNSLK